MQYVSRSDTHPFQNSSSCTVFEYPFTRADDINVAIVELSGRYPEDGFSYNEICKEVIHVVSGSGKVVTHDEHSQLYPGDMVQIDPKEAYYFEGEMTFTIASAPAWTPEQYRIVESDS